MSLTDEVQAWLRLANAELTPRAAHALLDSFGTPQSIFEAEPGELIETADLSEEQVARLLDPARQPSAQQLHAFERLGLTLITRDSPDYPPRLAEIADPPPCLFVRGRLDERDRFAIAIVGTRRPTPYGREVASVLSRDLCEMGFTIVSGGAVGIDTAAHNAALRAGGRTLVVLGCGLDVPYPAFNQSLFSEIVDSDQGAILSEYPLGATPEAWRFPARNRVISGLAMGVVVVEAGLQSGALITAGTAADQGREVMAVPGNIDRPSSAGTNALIMDGAALVTCAQDVAAHLGVAIQQRTPEERHAAQTVALPEEHQRVLLKLSLTPKHIDVIAAEASVSAADAAAILTLLELKGLVHRQAGGTYIRAL